MKKNLAGLLMILFATSLSFASGNKESSQAGLEIYVSPTGSDFNDGTMANPLKTPQKAQDKIDALPSIPKGGVKVILRGGTYLNEFVDINTTATADKPIIYTSYSGETAIFDGSVLLENSGFKNIVDENILNRLDPAIKSKVLVYDLGAKNIDSSVIDKVGFGWDSPPATAIELVVNNTAQILARWPNNNEFVTTGTIVDQGFIPRTHEPDEDEANCNHPPREDWITQQGPKFRVTIDEVRGDKWLQETDAWFSGYWVHDWAIDNLNTKAITKDNTGYIVEAVHPSRYGAKTGQRFYAFNMLCELDTEGEFYIDRESNLLYFYPSGGTLDNKDISIKLVDKPFIAINNSAYVTIENIEFTNSRADGVIVSNSDYVKINGCDFKELNGRAVVITDGSNCGVLSSNIARVGQGGIYLTGGDRNLLTDANHYAINNDISDYQRVVRTYTPAIQMIGCGLIAKNNLIYNAPHVGIQFSGNNMLIENNDIFNVCYETDDCGAIYAMRDWTKRGNTINNNYIHDIGKGGGHGAAAIYLDDCFSSASVTNNLLKTAGKRAILLGGGRDNEVKHNIIIDSPIGVYLDERGLGWASHQVYGPNGSIFATYKEIYDGWTANPLSKTAWDTAYPEFAGTYIQENDKGEFHVYDKNGIDLAVPSGNTFVENIMVAVPTPISAVKSAEDTGEFRDNISFDDVFDLLFANTSALDFTFVDKTKIMDELPDFVGIDITNVGLYIDEYRTSL